MSSAGQPPRDNPSEGDAELAATLARLPLFSRLTEGQLDRLAAGSRRHTLARGELLFTRGTPSTCFYLVVTGTIQLSIANAEGVVKVVEIIRAGQSFGEAVLFVHQPFPVDAVALEPTTVVEVPGEVLDELLDADPQLSRAMLAALSARLHSLVRDIEMLTLRSAAQRVVGFLVGELPEAAATPARLRLGSPAHVLASRLGMSPETFSRVLRELQDAGLVVKRGRELTIVDPAALVSHVT